MSRAAHGCANLENHNSSQECDLRVEQLIEPALRQCHAGRSKSGSNCDPGRLVNFAKRRNNSGLHVSNDCVVERVEEMRRQYRHEHENPDGSFHFLSRVMVCSVDFIGVL